MLYKIVPKEPITSILDAESPEAAMDGFAWAFDFDLNTYFEAVPASTEEITAWKKGIN